MGRTSGAGSERDEPWHVACLPDTVILDRIDFTEVCSVLILVQQQMAL